MKRLIVLLALLCFATPVSAKPTNKALQASYELGADVGMLIGWMLGICDGSVVLRLEDPTLADAYFAEKVIPPTAHDLATKHRKLVYGMVKEIWTNSKTDRRYIDSPKIVNGYQACVNILDAKTRGY